MYPVIQQKSSTSTIQGIQAANRTGEEKVQTTYQTGLSVLPCEHPPARGKHPRQFPCFVCFFFYFFYSHCSSSQTMGNMEKSLPQYHAAFNGLHSFVHLRAPHDSRQMTLFRPVRTLLLGKMPFVMTFLANGRLARLTTRCLCFGPLLTQVSGITGTSVYVTQWDERSMHSIFQAVACSSPDFLDVFAVFLAKTY